MNVDFLGGQERALNALRVVILLSAMIGALVALEAVRLVADLAMGLLALVNLVAIVRLGRWATGSLRDWERQDRLRATPVFDPRSPDLPRALDSDAWRSTADRQALTHGT